jgi:hypothetical protein
MEYLKKMETIFIKPKETLQVKITCPQHGQITVKVRAPAKSNGIAISGISCPFWHWPLERPEEKPEVKIKLPEHS